MYGRYPTSHEVCRHEILHSAEPNGVVQRGGTIRSGTTRFETAPLGTVVATRGVGAPKRSGSPHRPADIFWVIVHVADQVVDVVVAHGVVVASEFGDHGLELVRLQPGGQWGQVSGTGLVTDLVLAAEVVVEVLVDIDGGVVDRVADHVEIIAGRRIALRRLQPCVSTGVPVPGSKNHLLGTDATDPVNGGLVVLQDQFRRHIVRLRPRKLAEELQI